MTVTVTVTESATLCVGVVALAIASQVSCYGTCLSCACTEDADCASGAVCNLDIGLCEESATPCEAHDECEEQARCDFTTGECTNLDVCRSSDECADLFVCDLANRHCVQDACDADDDCELEEAPRCDVDQGICLAPEGG